MTAPSGRAPAIEIVERVEDLDDWLERWDDLAAACRRPFQTPGLALAWWRHMRPPGAELRVVLLREGDDLVGIAPLLTAPVGRPAHVELRPLVKGIGTRLAPFALPGHEPALARAVGDLAARHDPRADVVTLDGLEDDSPWPALLAEHASARGAATFWRSDHVAPTITLPEGDLDAWLATRSSNFRQQMRRLRRKVERGGGAIRMIEDPDEVPGAVAAMARLHRARWATRGRPGAIDASVEALFADAGRDLVQTGAFRLWVVEHKGETIASQLLLAAGGEVVFWNGGWDESHRDLKPGLLALLGGVEDALAREDDRIDLGLDAPAYKLRFADAEQTLRFGGLVPRGRGAMRRRLLLAPDSARRAARRAFQRLPEERRAQVRGLVGRVARRG